MARDKRKRAEISKLDATPPWETKVRTDTEVTTGPYDERDAPDDGLPRLDFGALQVPPVEGIGIRLELNEAKQVIAVTLVGSESTAQLGVFAAPRNEGIWDEVRSEIASSLNAQRGQAKEVRDGTWGTELVAKIPGEGGSPVPVRFVGVDGPRWFLRAMFIGAAAEPAKAGVFDDVLRKTIIVRGSDPLPVREPVPLRLPKDAVLPDIAD